MNERNGHTDWFDEASRIARGRSLEEAIADEAIAILSGRSQDERRQAALTPEAREFLAEIDVLLGRTS